MKFIMTVIKSVWMKVFDEEKDDLGNSVLTAGQK